MSLNLSFSLALNSQSKKFFGLKVPGKFLPSRCGRNQKPTEGILDLHSPSGHEHPE